MAGTIVIFRWSLHDGLAHLTFRGVKTNSNDQNLELVSGCKTVKRKNVAAFIFDIMQHLGLLLQYNGTYHYSPINVVQQNSKFMKNSIGTPRGSESIRGG